MSTNEHDYRFWADQIDSEQEAAENASTDTADSPIIDEAKNTENTAVASAPAMAEEPSTIPSDASSSAISSAYTPNFTFVDSATTHTAAYQEANSDNTAAYHDSGSATAQAAEPSPHSNVSEAELPHTKHREKKNRPVRRFVKKAVSFLAAAAVFGCVAGASFIGVTTLYYRLNPEERPALPSDDNDKPAPELVRPTISSTNVAQGTTITTTDVSGIVDSAMPSLVSISCTFRTSTGFFGYLYEGTTEGSGSGIIVGNNDTELLIATNNHVIDEALSITVTFADGTTQTATIKGTDSSNDLAIISVPLASIKEATREAISVATLGNSDDIKVGQMVIAIGNALGYGQTTTVGYISAKEREIKVTDSSTGAATIMTALQVDAAINPGNSGGALLNVNGEVIGINSAKLSDTAVEGIGYAIPISNVMDILTELMNREILTEEERGYLGVYLSQQDITEEVSAIYGWPIGVYVTETAPDGAGAKYGILAGDIITGINGTKITSYTQLQERVTSFRSGTAITVTLQRMKDGAWEEHELEVVLGSKADFDE